MASVIEDQKPPDKPSFSFVGTDYSGPLNVKIGRLGAKRYVCLFTCPTTRPVHIEVTHGLTTDSCISTFQRFTSRRGIPEKLYSDNGTNLVSGEPEPWKSVNQWNKINISNYMSLKEICWTFNPPTASYRGGVQQKIIRTTRKILKALVSEQLLTLMAETERIIFDRPISPFSNDVRDLQVLTLNTLILIKSNTSIPQGVFDEEIFMLNGVRNNYNTKPMYS
ncbi:unnamed protein product [Mytilus coruscus]|uniref:Integrase catalytic domain-containing protein n=1 Tax=Mytilus coruscus TaxID=42192 RepID=A0A6J7ZVD3_MYTCO|nr:unnamed protein product [Mytilus coruscus]